MESRGTSLIALPEIFVERMKGLLNGSDFHAFIQSYIEPSLRGLRWNLLKTTPSGGGDVIPWCKSGFIFPSDTRPAKSISYHAGLFYIQEPSAMCPAEVLKPKPGDRVLDICAAPGGKSVQIAGHLQGEGVLISNDASASRSRALVKNLERAGVTNAIVTTELPKKLAERFPEYFDCILVDAPCSGEGMFRRDEDLVKAYTANKPEACVLMQREILYFAAMMLKSGGRLVYSTCTFNTMENEDVMIDFLDKHDDFELISINHDELGIKAGLNGLNSVGRIWPHHASGEGHFVALLQKKGTTSIEPHVHLSTSPQVPQGFFDFCRDFLQYDFPREKLVLHGTNVYLQPEKIDLRGLRIARSGWHLGECAKGRFIPSQALAMGLRKAEAKFTINLSHEDAIRYLRGESLAFSSHTDKSKSWVLVCYNDFPLGWAKLVQGRLKNNLPTGWVTSL
ncbi:MAG: RsmB/NOP family class I SAM-dependent RNA methyltransferase [Defluviitaleaceae bacterium]|nr:RsmB/NOP family class I SAM-dependent RNA methyltransferase [Defluviitaleaceae bacterium]